MASAAGSDTKALGQQVVEIPVSQICEDPRQPRSDITGLDELVVSIEQSGLLQPIVVRPDPERKDGYIVVAGHRRFRAHQGLNRPTVPALIRKVNEQEALGLALIENLQREDLSPFDEAQAYQRLVDEAGLTQRQVGQVVGKKETVISETLRFLKLPEEIRNEYAQYPVAKSMLIQLIRRKSKKERLALWEAIKQGHVKTIEDAREFEPEKTVKPGEKSERVQYSVVLSSARRMTAIPSSYLQENQRHYRRLVEIAEQLSKRVEELRAEIGEPEPEEEQTEPMQPA